MNSNGFFMPGYMGMANNMMPVNPMMRLTGNALRSPLGRTANIGGISRRSGLFSKITGGIRSFNWGGLLTNANKTLNVVNQAIPLVRQAGPMVNNMKNMVKIAKVFSNETTNNKGNRHLNNNNNNNNNNISMNNSNFDNNINNSNNTIIENTSINLNNDKNITTDSHIYNYDKFNQKKEIQNSNSPNFFV